MRVLWLLNMQKENKDNLTDLVGMVSKPQPKPNTENLPPGTVMGQDGKPVTLGVEGLHTAALPNTSDQRNRRPSAGFLALFGIKSED